MSENKICNGGPAFPVPLNPGASYQGHEPYDGMTLRDYFAVNATDGDISDIMCKHTETCYHTNVVSYKITRQQARYMHADAMLKAREVGSE